MENPGQLHFLYRISNTRVIVFEMEIFLLKLKINTFA